MKAKYRPRTAPKKTANTSHQNARKVGRATRRLDPTIALPTAPNEPSADINDHNLCIYGEKGIGKSTLASQFPNIVAYFMWETGRWDLRTPMIPRKDEEPLTWPRFMQYLELLLQEHEPGRIVIDTIDLCARGIQDYFAAKANAQTMGAINDHGRTWDALKTEWYRLFGNLIYQGFRFTLVSHARNRPKVVRGIPREELKEALQEGVIVTETQPTVTGWAYEWLKIPVGYAFYYGWYGHDRALYVRGNQRLFASLADNESHFLQKKGVEYAGEPYDAILMGRSPKDVKQAFSRLLLGWENKLDGIFITTEEYEQES